jgi:hypothetical protein
MRRVYGRRRVVSRLWGCGTVRHLPPCVAIRAFRRACERIWEPHTDDIDVHTGRNFPERTIKGILTTRISRRGRYRVGASGVSRPRVLEDRLISSGRESKLRHITGRVAGHENSYLPLNLASVCHLLKLQKVLGPG